jgi:DMSO reductase anchor subunit
MILFTTLSGTGQGMFVTLAGLDAAVAVGRAPHPGTPFFVLGAVLTVLLCGAGLVAATFHLGHPMRAWRAMAMWRTSWLSREVIVLPAFMAVAAVWGLMQWQGLPTLAPGLVGTVLALGLFLCTGMIYACIKFLQEWATPMTPFNYFLLGTASGFTFAAAYAQLAAPALMSFFAGWAITLTLVALLARAYTLIRNARLKAKSTVQTAIGVRHNRVEQRAMGMMGGSYNTREYRHGKTLLFMKSVKWIFLVLVFPVPVALLWLGMNSENLSLLMAAFAVQYIGLLFERWFFFAQANHPQNLYYQVVG